MARIPNPLLPVKAQMSMCLDNIAYGDKTKTATAKVRWYKAKHRGGSDKRGSTVHTQLYTYVHVLMLTPIILVEDQHTKCYVAGYYS